MALACFLFAAVACAPLKPPNPRLPPSSAIPCCWVSEEKIELHGQSGKHEFIAALLIQPDEHTLVLIDALGAKVLVSKRQHNTIELETDLSNGKIPIELLWAAINLVHAQPLKWPVSSNTWQLNVNDGQRLLAYKGRPWAIATIQTMPLSNATELPRATIEIPAKQLRLEITTLARSAL